MLSLCAKRSSLLPSVPAVAETVPGYETKAWMGLVAPAGVPEAVVAKIHADVVAITKDPGVLSAMSAQGLDVDLLDQAQFAKRIESDIGMWKRIVIEAGVKVD